MMLLGASPVCNCDEVKRNMCRARLASVAAYAAQIEARNGVGIPALMRTCSEGL